jgi:cytochrome P450
MNESDRAIPFPITTGSERPVGFAELRATNPLTPMIMPSGDEALVCLTYADMRKIFSDNRFSRDLTFPGAPRLYPGEDASGLSDMLMYMDPPRHTRLRRIMAGAFTPRRVEGWRPRVLEITEQLADEIAAQGPPIDLMSAFAFPLPMRVICELMGVPPEDHELFRAWADMFLSTSEETAEERAGSVIEFAGYVANLIAESRHRSGDTLINALLEAHDEGDRLSKDELLSTVIGLIIAGHETTAAVLGRGMITLLSEPEMYAELVRDPQKIPAAVEEMVRYHVPGDLGFLRVATEDVELPSGAVVRKGQAVMPPPWAANRDPAVFADPDRFDIDRPACPHLGFGHGTHFCLGVHLARQELQVSLGMLTVRFPGLRPAVDFATLPWTIGLLVRRPLELPVTW